MIRELGPVRREEMFRAFNMGIGFCIIVDSGESAELIEHFSDQGIAAYQIGVVKPGIEGAIID
jgi:phosphoribosylformylglycinamidine cyclo-ligase